MMITLQTVWEAEEQLLQWHRASRLPAPPEYARHEGSVPLPARSASLYGYPGLLRARVPRLALLLEETRRGVALRATRAEATPAPATVSTLALLQAVAWGEITPKAAYHLLSGTVSTLALLQAVAGGEVSPRVANHLLGKQT